MPNVATLLTPRASRLPIAVKTRFVGAGVDAEVTVINLTVYGFMAETECDLRAGQAGAITLPDGEVLIAEIRWVKRGQFGAQFIPALRTFTLAKIISQFASLG